ncbi:MAG: hypothetical protein KBF45_11555 [Cyclobacteriaceae bacterium]|nr:hypothetical protein [Cyclobacteriaceae bacterium]
MMKVLRILPLLLISVSMLTYTGCKNNNDDPETVADIQFDKLNHVWKINTATFDGSDKTADYTGFQLTLSGTKGTPPFTYSTSGRPSASPWPASGKWDFGSSPETIMIRDKGTPDELSMTYTVTESTLSISFSFNGDPYSRTSQVKGAWVYTFTL